MHAPQNSIYVNGEWVAPDDNGIIEVRNPSDTDVTVSRFPNATREATRAAIDAAVTAQADWAALPPPERGNYLRETAKVLADRKRAISRFTTQETGKTLVDSKKELERGIATLNYYAELSRDYDGVTKPSSKERTLCYTTREPLGTAGIITPWNYPIPIAVWKLAPALVTGNTVVSKPASNSPGTNAVLVDAFDAAGLPAGVLNFVTGSGSTVGDEIVTNDRVDVISFTGSYDVGKSVYESATTTGKRAQCEMGGKNPLVVDDTADLDVAVELTVKGGFRNAGQVCVATSRAIVFEDVYEEYLERLEARTEALVVGDPMDEETYLGPKVSEDALETDLRYVEIGQDEGADLRTGGQKPSGSAFDNGHFIQPTVFADVEADMRIAQEEIFGPVISVLPVANFEEAVEAANGVQYGLTASICTNRLDRAQTFVDKVEAGIVKVNQTTGFEVQMPFGGRKHSSTDTYKEQGHTALDFFTHEKAVYLKHESLT